MKRLGLPTIFIVAVFMLAFARPTMAQNPESTTISVWFHAAGTTEGIATMAKFAEIQETQGITIDVAQIQAESYNEQVRLAAFGASVIGEMPCLLEFDGPNMYSYVWQGLLRPLDAYVSPELLADFLPSIIQQGTYADGHLYSLGQYDSGLALWGNKAHLEAAGVRLPTVESPWTLEEFESVLAALAAQPAVEYPFDITLQLDPIETYPYFLMPVLKSFGADLIDRSDYQSAEGVLNGPNAISAFETLLRWKESGYMSPETDNNQAFIEGRVSLTLVGHWMYNTFNEALGDNLILLPIVDFGNGAYTDMGSWNWAITTQCETPDLAWDILQQILSPEVILATTDMNGAVPARLSALEQSNLYGESGPLRLYIDQNLAGFTIPRPITPAYPVISRSFATAARDILLHDADIQSALDESVRLIDADIRQNNGYQ